MIEIKFKLFKNGKLPTKAYEDDAGWDLYANGLPDYDTSISGASCQLNQDECFLSKTRCEFHKYWLGDVYVGSVLKVMVGFAMAMPSGWFGDIRPRSGLATKSRLTPANTPGTVDAGYREEISVVLMNLGSVKQEIFRGDKIGQLLFLPVPLCTWVVSDLENSQRGLKGYGSSGS